MRDSNYLLDFLYVDDKGNHCTIVINIAKITLDNDSLIGWNYLVPYAIKYSDESIKGFARFYNITGSACNTGNHSEHGYKLANAISFSLKNKTLFVEKFNIDYKVKLILEKYYSCNDEINFEHLKKEASFRCVDNRDNDVYADVYSCVLTSCESDNNCRLIAVIHPDKEPTDLGQVKIKMLLNQEIIPLLVRKKIDLSNFYTI